MVEASTPDPEASADSAIWDSYNSLLLSSDIGRIRKLMVRYDLFRRSLDVPGDVVECGVFKGTGLMYWLKLLEIYSHGSQKRVVGFDTFGGFADSLEPYERSSAEGYTKEAEYEGGDPESLRSLAVDMGLGERVELVAGDVAVTAPAYVRSNPGFRISLLHLDLDTYQGTRAALEAFYPVMSRSGVIVLDEYGSRGWGESDAVDEFFAGKSIHVRAVPHASSPTAYAIKP